MVYSTGHVSVNFSLFPAFSCYKNQDGSQNYAGFVVVIRCSIHAPLDIPLRLASSNYGLFWRSLISHSDVDFC